MDSLPCEINLVIIQHLESGSLNHFGLIPQVPNVSNIAGDSRSVPLKALSCTCRKWRGLLFDKLFSRAVIRVGQEEHNRVKPTDNSSDATRFRQALKATGAQLKCSPYGQQTGNVCNARVASLTVRVDDVFMTAKAMRNSAQHSTDIITICEFWRRVFDVIDPLRLSVVAPVTVLGWLTTAVPEMGDAWAFPDMTLQMLELTQESHIPLPSSALAKHCNDAWDTEFLFNARPWQAIRLVEGSMLQAYGVYEYFHKVPPSVVRALVFPRSDRISSFSDHVLFPFNSHIEQLQLVSLSYYKHIHLHFSPWPNAHILVDRQIVGHAHLDDCWREMEQIYRRAVAFDPPSPLFREGSFLREFSTGDYEVDSVREVLDCAFEHYADRGWRAVAPGKWAVVDTERE